MTSRPDTARQGEERPRYAIEEVKRTQLVIPLTLQSPGAHMRVEGGRLPCAGDRVNGIENVGGPPVSLPHNAQLVVDGNFRFRTGHDYANQGDWSKLIGCEVVHGLTVEIEP